MTVYPVVWIILFGIIGAVVLAGVLSSYLDAASPSWRLLADRYPPEPAAAAARDSIRIWIYRREEWERLSKPIGCLWWILFPIGWWMWWRRAGKGLSNVRYTVGEDHLHLDLESGRLGAQRAMSLPLGALELIGRHGTHLGEIAWFALDEFVLGLPVPMVEQELELRTQLAAADGPPAMPPDTGDGK